MPSTSGPIPRDHPEHLTAHLVGRDDDGDAHVLRNQAHGHVDVLIGPTVTATPGRHHPLLSLHHAKTALASARGQRHAATVRPLSRDRSGVHHTRVSGKAPLPCSTCGHAASRGRTGASSGAPGSTPDEAARRPGAPGFAASTCLAEGPIAGRGSTVCGREAMAPLGTERRLDTRRPSQGSPYEVPEGC